MMRHKRRQQLTLAPLLQIYVEAGLATGAGLGEVPALGQRFRAVLAAREGLLRETFLDQASEDDFRAAIVEFYQDCVSPPLFVETVSRKAGFLRHAIVYLLRGHDPLPHKAEQLLSPTGAYHTDGLGPAFWSAVFQGLDPLSQPGCLPGVLAGTQRLGISRPQGPTTLPAIKRSSAVDDLAHLRYLYGRLLAEHRNISALHLDHFFSLVAGMRGRDLWSGVPHLTESMAGADIDAAIRGERTRMPLRRMLKERGKLLARADAAIRAAIAGSSAEALRAALEEASPGATSGVAPEAWPAVLTLAAALWSCDDPAEVLDNLWQANLPPALPALLLHLRDPKRFFPWTPELRQGMARICDAEMSHLPPARQYRFFVEAAQALCERRRIHPLELPAVLAALGCHAFAGGGAEASAHFHPAKACHPTGADDVPEFTGLCPDTFRFLTQLHENNSLSWMNRQRPRYQFVLREPLVELCRSLARRYVQPVLNERWGLGLETAARTGKALTSICKNDYGRSAPYQDCLWVTFGRGRKDVQFFARVARDGVGFGVRLGRDVRDAGRRFRKNLQDHAEPLYEALEATGALADCVFSRADDGSDAVLLKGAADLRAWGIGKTLVAGKFYPADAPILRSEELVGEIILTFDRLLPVFLFAAMDDPVPLLRQRLRPARAAFTADDFCRHTGLPADWLQRARRLLDLKHQLILQGVPGTGKTFVARQLARWLTGGRDEAQQLVQFHPAFSYEEFVEGIKARSVETDGRHEVTYPVEEGVLCDFAARAERNPAQNHVLLIDEINRGNLPRIFGELLYLLEYRGESVVLPYSRKRFRLPANLYLIGTMNAADRSAALIDQALRRRFSFLEMAPDSAVLARFFSDHPPAAGPRFAEAVLRLFERLNASLRKDLGPHCQVGHSYFMVPGLDAARLQTVWDHQVRPLLDDYFAAQPGRAAAYDLDRLFQGEWREKKRVCAPGGSP